MKALVIAIAAAALVLVGILYVHDQKASEERAKQVAAEKARVPKDSAGFASGLTINNFYPSKSAIAPGESALLCYSVENAKEVEITPGIGKKYPSFSRCIEVSPSKTTKYTLSARDAEGHKKQQSATVEVVAPQIQAAEPRNIVISQFALNGKQPGGDTVSLCYTVEGADAVEIQPHALPRTTALRGCFYTIVKEDTTYTLTAYGEDGKTETKTLKVTAPASAP